MRGPDEAHFGHVPVECDQMVVEPEGVEQAHGLRVIAELRPAHGFPQLVHRPDAAGDGDEPVAEVGEALLALVHAGDGVELGAVGVGNLAAGERIGDHPDHLAPGIERAARHSSHQPEPPAAIDDPDPALRQGAADLAGELDVTRIGGRRGPAVDGQTVHVALFGPVRRIGQCFTRWRSIPAPSSRLSPG